MSILSDCCTPCPSVPAVNVPGSPGTNGINAFTNTTAAFALPAQPAQNATCLVPVLSTLWMAVGQIVFISDGTNMGTFQVVSVPASAPFTSASLMFLQYPGDSAPGTTVASGAMVTPAGVQSGIPIPVGVAGGGTGATAPAPARSNLGAAASGANGDISSLSGLTTPLPISEGGTGAATLAVALANLTIQSGVATLGTGTKTVTGVTITANSVIVCSLKTPVGTRTSWAGYVVSGITTGAGGTGQFTITAITDAAGNSTVLSSCTDVVNYIIIG